MEPLSANMGELGNNLNYFHDHSGLSWKQVSRLLNVPLRTVRMWASGLSNHSHESTIVQSRELIKRLDQVREATPEETLAKILESNGGKSLYRIWQDETGRKIQKIQFNSYDIFKEDMKRYKEEA